MFVSNTIIENLLQQKKARAAMTLDALFAADLNQWPSMDISTILAYLSRSGIAIGESLVRRGLFELSQLGLLTAKPIMTRGKGRPMWSYRIKTVVEMAKVLGVQLHRDENADSVPFDSFKSASAYRGAKHYSLLKRLGTSQLSRKKLGARLGVGGRSTYNYEIGKALTVTHRVERTPLTMADLPNAPTTRPKNNVFLEVKIERDMTDDEMRALYKDFDESYLLVGNRKTSDKRYMPYTQAILARELGRGHSVFKVKQITNEYKVA